MYFWDDKTAELIYPKWGYNHVKPIEMKAGEEIYAKL